METQDQRKSLEESIHKLKWQSLFILKLKKKQLKNSLCYNFNGIAESIVDKYLMKN